MGHEFGHERGDEMTQHHHEEFEVGQHLDQATRAAVTGVAQLLEGLARSSAERDRTGAAAVRDSLRRQLQQGQQQEQQREQGQQRGAETPARSRTPGTSRTSGASSTAPGQAERYLAAAQSQGHEGVSQVAHAWEAALVDLSRRPKDGQLRQVAAELDDMGRDRYGARFSAEAGRLVDLGGLDGLDNPGSGQKGDVVADERGRRTTAGAAGDVTDVKDVSGRSREEAAAVAAEVAAAASENRVEQKVRAAAAAEEQELAAAYDGRGSSTAAAPATPAVVLPAYRANPDRGVSPSKAGSAQEAQHRRQTWALARRRWEQETPQVAELSPAARQAAWDALAMQEKTDRFWSEYDTPEARTLQTAPGSAHRSEQVEQTPGRPAAAAASETLTTPPPARPPQQERGLAPSKAPNAAEAAHRRTAWSMAEAAFVAEIGGQAANEVSGVTGRDARVAWRELDWQDKALRYWTAYDDTASQLASQQASRLRGGDVAGPSAATASAPSAPSSAVAAAGEGVSRERVVELNEQTAAYFAQQATPGSKGRTYFESRVGADALEQLRSQQGWQVGYAPAGWTGLTDHLRRGGASNDEIVAAGLARVSSRGAVVDAFRDRAMVAVRDEQGATVGFVGRDLSGRADAPKYVNTGSTAAFRKGDHVLGLAEAPAGARLVRVEGPFDALAVSTAGQGRYAGVAPMGTALTNTQANRIAARAVDGRVWVALDADTAGQKATAADFWAMRDRGIDLRTITLDDGTDPAQAWRENPDRLRAELAAGDEAPTAGLVALDVALQAADEPLRAGDQTALEDLAWTCEDITRTLTPADARQVDEHARRALAQLQPVSPSSQAASEPSPEKGDAGTVAEPLVESLVELDEQPTSRSHATATSSTSTSTTAALTSAPTTALTDNAAHSSTTARSDTYSRGATVGIEHVTDGEAVTARRISGRGFSRPTADMLEQAQSARGVPKDAARASQPTVGPERRRRL